MTSRFDYLRYQIFGTEQSNASKKIRKEIALAPTDQQTPIQAPMDYDHVALPLELLAHVAAFAWDLDDAAAMGSLPLVRLLHRIIPSVQCSLRAMNVAASHGALDVVQFLHVHRAEGCSSFAMNMAAAHGHLSVVQFLHRFRSEGCTAFAMDAAAAHGHMEVIAFLHANRQEGCTTHAIDAAAANGHGAIVRFLLLQRREGFSCAAIDRAAEADHGEIVELLLHHRAANSTGHKQSPLTSLGARWAARNRHDRLAMRLYSGGIPQCKFASEREMRAMAPAGVETN